MKFSICEGKDVTHDMILETIQIDKLVFDKIFHISFENLIDLFEHNKEMYTLIIDESGCVAGYINKMCLKPEAMDLLLENEIQEKDIDKSYIVSEVDNGNFDILLCSIAIHPKYRNSRAILILLKGFVAWYDQLFYRNTVINRFAFEPVTGDGISLGNHFLENYKINNYYIMNYKKTMKEMRKKD